MDKIPRCTRNDTSCYEQIVAKCHSEERKRRRIFTKQQAEAYVSKRNDSDDYAVDYYAVDRIFTK